MLRKVKSTMGFTFWFSKRMVKELSNNTLLIIIIITVMGIRLQQYIHMNPVLAEKDEYNSILKA